MPFPFANKFSPKKTPPRRAQSLSNLNLDSSTSKQEFGLELGPVKLRLGGNEVAFEDGTWIQDSDTGVSTHRDVIKLRKHNQQITEENNLLKMKLEILLDMLSEATVEKHLQENEITQLKSLMKSGRR